MLGPSISQSAAYGLSYISWATRNGVRALGREIHPSRCGCGDLDYSTNADFHYYNTEDIPRLFLENASLMVLMSLLAATEIGSSTIEANSSRIWLVIWPIFSDREISLHTGRMMGLSCSFLCLEVARMDHERACCAMLTEVPKPATQAHV